MNTALDYWATRLGKTYVSTYATDIPINEFLTTQDRSREQIKAIAELCDHTIIETATEVIAIDNLLGYNTTDIDEFVILSESSVLNGSIINQFVTNYQKMEFDDIARNIIAVDNSVTLDTGYESGVIQNIGIKSAPCTFSSPDVIYSETVLETIQTRKNTLSQRSQITIEIDEVHTFDAGTRIEFDNNFATGFLVLKDLDPNYDTLKTKLSGIGEITFNASL